MGGLQWNKHKIQFPFLGGEVSPIKRGSQCWVEGMVGWKVGPFVWALVKASIFCSPSIRSHNGESKYSGYSGAAGVKKETGLEHRSLARAKLRFPGVGGMPDQTQASIPGEWCASVC